MSDPKRLLDDLGGGELKGLLEAGKSELPNDAQMLALAAKIGVAGALGGAGGAGAAGAGGGAGAGAAKAGAAASVVKGATAIKVGVAVAVVSAAGAGTVVATSKSHDVIDTKPSGIVAAPSVTTTSIASESLPPRVDPFASATGEVSAKPVAPAATKSAAPNPAPNPAEEVKMLERAQDALRSGRHAEALSLCNEHAKSFPNGMLAQEREVIAVEALVKTGRATEAKARAEKFKARFPGSSHTRRIDALVGP